MGDDIMLDTNFGGLSTGAFILRMKAVADTIENHPYFAGDCPEYVSKSDKLRQLIELLAVADRHAAEDGGKKQKAQKKAVRAESEQRLTFNAHHLTMLALHRKEPEMMLNAGYELKQKNSYHRNINLGVPEKPERFSVKNGPVSGTAIATISRPQVLGSILVQITEADPLVESSWRDLEKFYTCRMEMKGLDPVKKCHFRARYENAGGIGPWSSVVTLVVI